MMSHIKINPLKGIAIVLLTIVMPFPFFTSCNSEKKDIIDMHFDPQVSHTLKQTNVKTLISDSGVTKYKMIADTWFVFGKASEPYQYFPDRIYLEKFDTIFNVEASIEADTAYYYERRKIWELIGNVDISNFKGERFQTSQLFWDENKGTIYSDSFIKITNGDNVSVGYGFRSNQDMSEWEIYNNSADMSIKVNNSPTSADSTSIDLPNNDIYNGDYPSGSDSVSAQNNHPADIQ